MRAGIAERDAQRREPLRDLQLGQGLGDRDVDEAAVVDAPLGQVRLNGADAVDVVDVDVDVDVDGLLEPWPAAPPSHWRGNAGARWHTRLHEQQVRVGSS